jgi:hypothetical protein
MQPAMIPWNLRHHPRAAVLVISNMLILAATDVLFPRESVLMPRSI